MKENKRGWRTKGHKLFPYLLDEYNLCCVDGCYKDNIEYNYIRDNETKKILFVVPDLNMDNFDEYFEKYKIELRINKINKIINNGNTGN